MGNVLAETKQQQVIALGRLGWCLRRIKGATGVRRETVSGYFKASGIAVRGRGTERFGSSGRNDRGATACRCCARDQAAKTAALASPPRRLDYAPREDRSFKLAQRTSLREPRPTGRTLRLATRHSSTARINWLIEYPRSPGIFGPR